MSFSKDVKKEILDNKFASREQCLAFLCGLLYSSAEYEINDNNIEKFIINKNKMYIKLKPLYLLMATLRLI